jgi:hypothetical protein
LGGFVCFSLDILNVALASSSSSDPAGRLVQDAKIVAGATDRQTELLLLDPCCFFFLLSMDEFFLGPR